MSVLFGTMWLIGCSETPVIKGQVLDIWNNPIEGAMIQMEGEADSKSSDAKGEFSFPIANATDKNLRFRAGSTGYIHDVEVAVVAKEQDAEQLPTVVFHLYPEPKERGFYAVGSEQYIEIKGQDTDRIATKLEAYHGLNDIGKASFSTDQKQQFVFYSSLRKEQIKQMQLSLNELTFTEKEDLKGVLGETAVEVNLWTTKGSPISFGLRSLDQKNMYLLDFPEPLAKGVYAFHSGQFLSSADPRKESDLPKELQVAYPFEVK